MTENDPREAAADPPSEHATPGGQPGDHEQQTEPTTTVETPGGTTVTEEPAEASFMPGAHDKRLR